MSPSVMVDPGLDADDAETVRDITETAYRRSTERLPKDEDLTFEFDWTDEWLVVERMGGVQGWTDSDYCRLFPDSADVGVGAYR